MRSIVIVRIYQGCELLRVVDRTFTPIGAEAFVDTYNRIAAEGRRAEAKEISLADLARDF